MMVVIIGKKKMTDIIELAKEAGLWPSVTDVFPAELERFAKLVRAEVEAEWIETNKALAKEIIERQWVDLTDDEIDDAYTSDAHENTPKSFARAAIAKFKEKNK